MEIVMVHGYFLRGTGSNLFVANTCRELCKLGHQVKLFCQEEKPQLFDFIESAWEFDRDNHNITAVFQQATPYPGKCQLYRPNLNGFLPVYVYDHYPGYVVKTYLDCTPAEIEAYIEDNRRALDAVVDPGRTALVLSNHTIMQPVYVARSRLSHCRHVMTVHGSCLNFSVRHSLLLKEYAREALANAEWVAFVSHYSRQEFMVFFDNDPFLYAKSLVISGGVDLKNFVSLNDSSEKQMEIDDMLANLAASPSIAGQPLAATALWQTDEDVVSKLARIDFADEKIILYYGKYLWTKGVQLLIAAAPLVLMKNHRLRIILVGFGSSRDYFETLVKVLDQGDLAAFITLIRKPDTVDATIDADSSVYFEALLNKLNDPDFASAYQAAATGAIREAIVFTGYLGHQHLKSLIACCEITVAPSIFPEAFGLVAVEALASGIIPVLTNHSGFTEVISVYCQIFGDIFNRGEAEESFRLPALDGELVFNLARALNYLLNYYAGLSNSARQEVRNRARTICADHYTWEAVVQRYLRCSNDGVDVDH